MKFLARKFGIEKVIAVGLQVIDELQQVQAILNRIAQDVAHLAEPKIPPPPREPPIRH